MSRNILRKGAVVPTLLILALCMFPESLVHWAGSRVGSILQELFAAFRDAGAQWMIFVCEGIYFLAFLVVRRRLNEAGRMGMGCNASVPVEFWLAGLMGAGALAYTFDYTQAVKSTQALTLLGAAVLGQGAAVWAGWGETNLESRVQSPKSPERTVVGVLVVLLAGAAVWLEETGQLFQYRGLTRWSGPWDNPNTFGMLMGGGLVLTMGLLVQSLKSKVQSLSIAEWGGPSLTSKVQCLKSNACRTLLLAAAGVMGVGLVKSYSRGAWVGAVVGLGFLILQSSRFKVEGSRFKGRLALGVVVVSLGVLAFWGLRQAEWGMVRRAYSAANANDFSWRNRLAAYEGALQMMADKPWFGFGWSQPERVYDRYYQAAKVDEGAAIQLNDYLTLGTTLGLPALVCFAAYVGRCLVRSAECGVRSEGQRRSEAQSLKSKIQSPENGRQRAALPPPPTLDFRLWTLDYTAVCRAGAAVLLVGFWFDGGLFKLATAAPFWILLELGREESEPAKIEDGGLRVEVAQLTDDR